MSGDEDLIKLAAVPVCVTFWGLEKNFKTTVAAGLGGVAAGVMVSREAYAPMVEYFIASRQWEGYDPNAGGVIWGSKIGAGLICLLITLAIYTLSIALVNAAKMKLDEVTKDCNCSPRSL